MNYKFYMLQFLFSFLILLSILFWWAEVNYSVLYRVIEKVKKFCDDIKQQTKLKINICFIMAFLIIGLLIGYLGYQLFDKLYLPYFKEVLDPNNQLITLKKTSNINDSSLIGDWGTFGDFIGGTLNPIIGFISIILLFATWFVTYRTLEVSREELKESTNALKDNAGTQKEIQKTQKLQQFDSLFFNLLKNFQYLNVIYSQQGQHNKQYEDIFIEKNKNIALFQDANLLQYFSSLKLILITIGKKLDITDNLNEQIETQNYYVDIVLAQVPNGMLHILAWYAFQDKILQKTLENSGFFRNMDFKYYVDNKSEIFGNYNFELLLQLHRYDEKIFQNNKKFLDLKSTYLYEIFFGDEPFIYKFFQKQYNKEIVLNVEAGLTGRYELILTFSENGMEYCYRNKANKRLECYSIDYQNMIFTTVSILVRQNNNFGFIIPNGDVSKIQIDNLETYKLIDIKII